MRKPFEGNFPITQIFGNKLYLKDERGVEYDYYAQWTFDGHNGIDFGCPSGTPILAPHRGTVIEANYDQFGYGNYIKIENEDEGSVLAHLDSIKVQVGFEVKEGDIIGISDNTGKSTGAHLHWGYFKKPRNRQNGFDGYIDQWPILNPKIVIPEIKDGQDYTCEQLKLMSINPDETVSSQTVKGITFKLEDNKKGGRILKFVKLEVKPVSDQKENTSKMYTEEEYLALKKERDDALTMLKFEHENYIEFHTKYSAFLALGYPRAEDVTNTIREYEKKLEGIKLQLTQQLKQNADLAIIIATKNKEDSTAIEEAIKLGHLYSEAKDKLNKITQEIGAKADNVFDIIEYIKNVKKMATKAFDKGKEEMKKIEDAKKKKAQEKVAKSSMTNGFNWLMEFLFGKEGDKK